MFRERTRCLRSFLVGLTAAALLLSLPATGLAAERENQSGALASADLLTPGAGYGTKAGSKAVRQLQLRLRRLGDRPGPIDGLYGPRTEAAVERFQRSHGLAIDGVVGPQTKGRLLAQRAEQRPARAPDPTQTGNPERKSPAPDQRAESAPEPQPVRPSAGVGTGSGSAEPESSSGLPPLLFAIGAALVVASLVLTLRSRRRTEVGRRRQAIEARLSLGLVCAALLAAGVLGAALGALFATQAAPDDNDRTTADSGALLAARPGLTQQPAQPSAKTRSSATARASAPARRDADRRARANRTRSGVGTASTARAQVAPSAPAAPTPGAAAPTPAAAAPAPAPAAPAPAPPPATAPAPVAPDEGPADDKRADAVTYTVKPGDALWPLARDQLAPRSSDDQVARKVAGLKQLNLEDRIQSGDPDVIAPGEKLRLR